MVILAKILQWKLVWLNCRSVFALLVRISWSTHVWFLQSFTVNAFLSSFAISIKGGPFASSNIYMLQMLVKKFSVLIFCIIWCFAHWSCHLVLLLENLELKCQSPVFYSFHFLSMFDRSETSYWGTFSYPVWISELSHLRLLYCNGMQFVYVIYFLQDL